MVSLRSLALLVALLLAISGARAQVKVALPAMTHSRTNVPGHAGHDTVSQEGRITTGTITYGVRYCSCWDPAHAPGVGFLEGTIGMPEPTAANWYHGGFLHLHLNGQNLATTKISDFWVSEQGDRGSLRMYWDTPQAGVLATFLALKDDNRLFVSLQLTPKAPLATLELRLQAYPSFFTYANKRDGDRKLLTATGTHDQGQVGDLDPARQWWLALYDTIFDPDKGEGDGGCAVAYLPEQVEKANYNVGSYGCAVNLRLKPETRQVRLVFWDFDKHGNAASLQSLQEVLPATRDLLGTLDFGPLSLLRYPAAEKTVKALKELEAVPGSDRLCGRLREVSGQLVAAQETVAQGKAPSPAQAEKTLGDLVDQFEALLWEQKFFVLIHGQGPPG